MRFAPGHKLLVLALCVGALGLAGCGNGSSGAAGSGAAGSQAGEIPALSLTPGFENWPYFGRVQERTHYLPDDPLNRVYLDPPLKRAWSINTHALIEFPPAVHRGVAYVINKYGNGKAVRLSDRKVLWELRLDPDNKGEKPIDVTAPAYYEGKVFGAFLDGHLAAGDAMTGRKVWVRDLHTELESSPLPAAGLLFLGTNTRGVLAIDPGDGRTVWKFAAPGEVKASPSYHDGRVFVANYESSMFALDAKTGRLAWQTDTSKEPPYGSGGFFSSPAIAFGRVYAARDDGTVFAFDERSGRIEWSFATGGAVYGSPAVAKVPGTEPTVYIGSEDGTLYALDARSGEVRWKAGVGGPIPGTATVIGHTVYTTTFHPPQTLGFDVRTHRRVFHYGDGGYTPMVSDGKRLYLVGYYTLVGLEPTAGAKRREAAAAAMAAKRERRGPSASGDERSATAGGAARARRYE